MLIIEMPMKRDEDVKEKARLKARENALIYRRIYYLNNRERLLIYQRNYYLLTKNKKEYHINKKYNFKRLYGKFTVDFE